MVVLAFDTLFWMLAEWLYEDDLVILVMENIGLIWKDFMVFMVELWPGQGLILGFFSCHGLVCVN